MRESTRHNHCIKYRQKTCQDIENIKYVNEKFRCNLPILDFGHHANAIKDMNLPNCNQDTVKQILEIYRKIGSACNITLTCTSETFRVTIREHVNFSKFDMLDLTFNSPEVQYYHTYVSYDMLSFVSEVGGILGLTLGISGVSLFGITFNTLQNMIQRSKM